MTDVCSNFSVYKVSVTATTTTSKASICSCNSDHETTLTLITSFYANLTVTFRACYWKKVYYITSNVFVGCTRRWLTYLYITRNIQRMFWIHYIYYRLHIFITNLWNIFLVLWLSLYLSPSLSFSLSFSLSVCMVKLYDYVYLCVL